MGDLQEAPPRPDVEALCTRVVARVIEELSCIDIAPDSPEWTDLCQGDARAGQLAVYRGRSGIERMVSASLRLDAPKLSFHTVAVFTDPESLVPHLLVDALLSGSDEATAHVGVDLLPRVEPTSSPAYVRRCYTPLEKTQQAAARDARFSPRPSAQRPRAGRTRWQLALSVAPVHLAAAEACVQRYVDQWAWLMRTGISMEARPQAQSPSLAEHSRALRQQTFARQVDPIWEVLDGALGRPTVDLLLDALRGP